MAYPWVIQKVKDLISGLSATNQNVSNNASAISTLTPTPPPVGGIIDYYGALDTSGKYPMTSDGHINYNWHVCDGTDGTPNLVGKTVIGASKATYGNEGGSDTVTPSVTVNSATQSVSVNGHTLTTDEIPFWKAEFGCMVPNNHAGFCAGQAFPITKSTAGGYFGCADGTKFQETIWGYQVKSPGITASHGHGVTTSAHTHDLTISSFDNRSAYKALYKIMRLA